MKEYFYYAISVSGP